MAEERVSKKGGVTERVEVVARLLGQALIPAYADDKIWAEDRELWLRRAVRDHSSSLPLARAILAALDDPARFGWMQQCDRARQRAYKAILAFLESEGLVESLARALRQHDLSLKDNDAIAAGPSGPTRLAQARAALTALREEVRTYVAVTPASRWDASVD